MSQDQLNPENSKYTALYNVSTKQYIFFEKGSSLQKIRE